jgi:hypothetical protein
MDRRNFIRGLLTISGSAMAGLPLVGCGSDDEPASEPTVVARKSVKSLSPEEIARFVRAHEYAVARGYFDPFNDEHYDHHKHRHHGADVLACSPMAITASHSASAGYRLLPWHRSFILEAERMLRAALRERNRSEGKDPAEADLLFIPYWDAAHDQGLPQWLLDFTPKGGTAIVPPDLPRGHAGYGKPVGSRYDIVFQRWPGTNPVFDKLHRPDQVGRALAHDKFVDFYTALDVSPEIVMAQVPAAQAALMVIYMKRPDDPNVQTLIKATMTPPSTPEEQLALTNALLGVGYLAAAEPMKTDPDDDLIEAVEDLYSMFRFMPHLLLHLWAGGLDPKNPDVRGTVTYFNELVVDPVFWMLHTELDRYWYTWETTHAEQPPLAGNDRNFQPLTAEKGAWYGGGKQYNLDELTVHERLPYRYDALFAV